MSGGAEAGAMPAKVSEKTRPIVTTGLANVAGPRSLTRRRR